MILKIYRKSLISFLICGSISLGCSAKEQQNAAVVTSLTPVDFLVRSLIGADEQLVNVIPEGAEPHDAEVDADLVDIIMDARLVVIPGRSFQPAIEEVAANRERNTLLLLPKDDADGETHFWLDPILVAEATRKIANELERVFPEHRSEIESRSTELQQRLRALDEDIRARLRSCEVRTIVTGHQAFGAFAERYDLTAVGIAEASHEEEPNAERISEVAQAASTDGVTTIFYESEEDRGLAATVASEAGGLRLAQLSPLEMVPEGMKTSDWDYFEMMEADVSAIATALGCTA